MADCIMCISDVFDVYRSTKDFVRLLDFSPLAAPTDPVLFTWLQLAGTHCLRCDSGGNTLSQVRLWREHTVSGSTLAGTHCLRFDSGWNTLSQV